MSLAPKVSTNLAARIWAASYDLKRDAFRVSLENGKIFLMQRPIPEDDHSEVLEVYIEGAGEVFTVLQASGNEFSVPWDVITNHALFQGIHSIAGEYVRLISLHPDHDSAYKK